MRVTKRTKRELTQQALAEAAGIPQTHVSAIELGRMSRSLSTQVRLAIALDCKVAKLVAVLDEARLASLLRITSPAAASPYVL